MKFSDYEKALLKEFFQEVYGRVWEALNKHYPEAYIEIRMINQDNHIVREFFPIHTHGLGEALEEAFKFIEKHNGEEGKYNAYWGIAIKKEKKGTKEASIPYMVFVPFDLDILKDHLHLTEELSNMDEEEAKEKVLSYYHETIRPRLERFGLVPTWVYYTGHGVQGIWALKDFITEKELLEIKPYLVEAMGSDTRIYELARILRVPFSINWKVPEHPKKGELLEKNEVYYTFEDLFNRVKEYHKEYGPKTPPTSRALPELDIEIRRKFSQSKRPPCVEKALNGVKEGMRNNTAYFLASYFAQIGWKLEEIMEFLKKEWDPRNDPPIADNDGVRSLEATIKSAYESVIGKGDNSETPMAQKMAGCSWARSNGLCPFKTMAECPIGRRALANKLKEASKLMEVKPYTLEEFEKLLMGVQGAPKWKREILTILQAEGLSQVTPLDIQKIVGKLSPPSKKIDRSPREFKDKEGLSGEVRSLDDFTEEELKLIIRHYVMEAIKLDTNKATLSRIRPPFLFLMEEKRGRKVVFKLNKRLLGNFAKKLGVSFDELISGWDLVAKIQEAFGIPDSELRFLIVEAIKDMLSEPYMRLPTCIEALVDKLAEGEKIEDPEVDILISWIKYRSQGKERARAKKGYDKRLGLWEFMVEMLPGFEGNLGYWRLEFLKRYEKAKPIKCPREVLGAYCDPDRCPFVNPRDDNIESILAEIEAVYISGEKIEFVVDGEPNSIKYEPLSDITPSTLKELHKALDKAWGGPLKLSKEDLAKILEDMIIRGIWKPSLEIEDIVRETLTEYFVTELETGVLKYPLFVKGYLTYDEKRKVIYVAEKTNLFGYLNRVFERHGLKRISDPRELTPILNKLDMFLGTVNKSVPLRDTNNKVIGKPHPWMFSVSYIEKVIGREINVKFLKPEEVFFEAEEGEELPPSMNFSEKDIMLERIQREILELLKREPKSDWDIVKELKKKYPKEDVERALKELLFEGEISYDPSTDKLKVREG